MPHRSFRAAAVHALTATMCARLLVAVLAIDAKATMPETTASKLPVAQARSVNGTQSAENVSNAYKKAPRSPNGTRSAPSGKEPLTRKEAQASWARSRLPQCAFLPALCLAHESKLKDPMAAAALMIDSLPVVRMTLVMLACFLFYLASEHCDPRRLWEALPAASWAPRWWGTVSKGKRWLDMQLDGLAVFWSSQLPMEHSRAVVSMKLFVFLLTAGELLYMDVPQQDILATPELVLQLRRYALDPRRKGLEVADLTRWLLPGLDDGSADDYALRLQHVRSFLFVSWCVFLACPPERWRLFSVSYAAGAVAYFLLGSLGLMYSLSHTTQGPMLFVLGATLAMPSLASSARTSAWLRQFLITGLGP